ncbi:DUF4345 domain-containing protein [Marinobacter sp. R17]|uniref:DUF4345 domain-containing protein n=1 Tax=Marinobacter sp. R17 TaxID=2484250 RepID=UPI000F4CCC54|nr:DUF4345 domain-containing protein [Marinobacter sp. R17]ROU01461.1 DUF4345 domain-containing protein [Marinobacter sp. R17]
MSLEAAFVRLNAAIFAVYGIAFIALPETLSRMVTGEIPASATGLTDMRATYGGMSLGIGIVLLILTLKTETLRLGVLGVVILMLCMAGGRSVGLVIDGVASQTMVTYLMLELAMAALAFWVLVRSGGSNR